jgi:predicted enzyme related to lactoylglutathione lyase
MFWSGALGAEREPFDDMEQQIYRRLRLPGENIRVLLQAVPESKSSKTRVHVDIETDDVDAEVRRLKLLGASETRRVDELGFQFCVMVDPFDNEFCVIQPEFPELLAKLGETHLDGEAS